MRYDSGYEDPSRFIFFVHCDKQKIFEKGECFFVDETFKTAPRPFYQCLVIHCLLLGKAWAYSYVLMMTKTERDYERVFNKVKEITNIKPLYFGVDYEKGLSNALRSVFNVKIRYCFFHFGQSIWRKIQQIGLSVEYNNNEAFKSQ